MSLNVTLCFTLAFNRQYITQGVAKGSKPSVISRVNQDYRGTIKVPSKNYRGEIECTEAEFWCTLDKYRGKIEFTEAEFMYPRKNTEAEFWLMLHSVLTKIGLRVLESCKVTRPK